MNDTSEQLSRIEEAIASLRSDLKTDVESLERDVEKLDYKFETYQGAGERLERLATFLIAGATISVIAGTILLLLKA
ncbi:hypothetical protein [Synechococcus sp. PCC 7336]|uniref:hypothetical protein n=1 Tax=Synechococcus sp. PCC 7336 TaxID=195250 RepID=UPI00034AE534|nr:hypothetical protein [Synechococcus sp. PCC 7336]